MADRLAESDGSRELANTNEKVEIAAALRGFRFHDLRHQAVTELAEGGASDATLQAIAEHMSRQMMEHYSHVSDGGEAGGGGEAQKFNEVA